MALGGLDCPAILENMRWLSVNHFTVGVVVTQRSGSGVSRQLLRGRRLRPLGWKAPPTRGGGGAFAVDRRVSGNYLGTGFLWTVLVIGADDQWLEQMFGDIWEWTQSK